IQSVSDDGQEFEITYMGFGTQGTATITTLRQIVPPPHPVAKSLAKKGYSCKALYIEDGVYYDCTIQEVTAHGYKVIYTAYGNVEEVPLEYLQRESVQSKAEAAAAEAATEADASFAIPERLRPQPGDTETEKERKRKKVKALKAKFKVKQKEAQTNNKQASWKAFQTKGAKKKTKGSMSSLAIGKGSIFASPDGLDGKVGVTGSGKGLTEQRPRKKFKKTGTSS
ncbi:unnamed protein product, partial [Choristocarpus tenellus]